MRKVRGRRKVRRPLFSRWIERLGLRLDGQGASPSPTLRSGRSSLTLGDLRQLINTDKVFGTLKWSDLDQSPELRILI